MKLIGPPFNLRSDHTNTFIQVLIVRRGNEGDTRLGGSLGDLLSGMPKNSNGFRVPVILSLAYKDKGGVCYVSRHVMAVDDSSEKRPVEITWLNSERL
jgi:hypothetical protein